MNRVTLFGASYSVYVRIVRLALMEIGVPYDPVEIDIFAKEGIPAEYGERHPFGRIPAFEHGGFRLFETDAIVGYILDRFGDHELIPRDIRQRARMRQIMRIMDNYGYRDLVWGIYVEETERGRAGALQPDELERAAKCLSVIEGLAAAPFLVGTDPTVADLWALPMLAYLRLSPSGNALLRAAPKLNAWLDRMQDRASVQATRFPAEMAVA
jgi:glutathione S-transferase